MLIINALFISACSTANINYLGKSFNATTQVDVYFDDQSIGQNYEIIGAGVASCKYGPDNNIIIQKLIDEARIKGANAILINEAEKEVFTNKGGIPFSETQIGAYFLRFN